MYSDVDNELRVRDQKVKLKIKQLINNNPKANIFHPDIYGPQLGNRPLFAAIVCGDPDLVDQLIRREGDVNEKAADDLPLLIAAVDELCSSFRKYETLKEKEERYQIVRCLLENKADVNACYTGKMYGYSKENYRNETALHSLLDNFQYEINQVTDPNTHPHIQIWLKTIILLINAKANLHAKNHLDITPLDMINQLKYLPYKMTLLKIISENQHDLRRNQVKYPEEIISIEKDISRSYHQHLTSYLRQNYNDLNFFAPKEELKLIENQNIPQKKDNEIDIENKEENITQAFYKTRTYL